MKQVYGKGDDSMNHIRRSKGEIIFSAFNYFILTVLMFLCFYPMLFVAFSSLSDSQLLTQHNGLLFKPLGFSLEAYKMVFRNPMIIRGYGNTLFLLIFGVTIQVFMTSLGAYFLSRKNVMWKTPIMFLITFTMFFSGGMIPFYLTIRDLKLTNSLWGLIIPFMISTYNMIIMRTSFAGIPDSLEESAMLDGAGHFRILFTIVLPLSKAIIAVMVLYYGVSIWNGWFWASTLIRKREMYPLQVILREILLSNDISSMSAGTDAGDQEAVGKTIKYATIIVATLPILTAYPFLQKHFVKGVMIGAIKG